MTKNDKRTSLISALLILGISAAAAEAVHLVKKLAEGSAKETAESVELAEAVEEETEAEAATEDAADEEGVVVITPVKAKEIMDAENGYVILDVRERGEYAAGHIPGSKLIPLMEINDRAESELPDKEQLILVYCRTGRRSHTAAKELAALGYTNVKDFGGILDWPYAIAK